MNNEKKDYQAAVLVHECLRARTDCFGNDGKIVKTAYIVCIDDDPDSAIHAVRLAKQHFAAHGFFPKMLCVGNKGLLSRCCPAWDRFCVLTWVTAFLAC